MNLLQDIIWRQLLTYLTIAFIIYYAAAIGVLIKAWWQNAWTAACKKWFGNRRWRRYTQILESRLLTLHLYRPTKYGPWIRIAKKPIVHF
jgi:hypothetical protein